MTGDAQRCTKASPMPPGSRGRWQHDDAHEIDDSQRDGWPGGDTVRMICPNCGTVWIEELPQ